MRVACVLIKNLPVQIILRDSPDLDGRPLVVAGLPSESGPVLDASPEAMAHGVRPGMALRQAHALCPDAVFLPSDGQRYRQTFARILDLLDDHSPTVDVETPGGACLDVTGVSNEQQMARDIVADIHARTGLAGSVGMSNGQFFSRVAAATSKPEAPVIVPRGKEKDFIAPFSLDFLSCSAETKARLRLFGVRTIGQLDRFSQESLVAQFGNEGTLIFDLANGTDRTLLTPRDRPQVVSAAIDLEPPATINLQVLHACQVALQEPLGDIRAKGKACREILARIVFASGGSQDRKLYLKQPTASMSMVLHRLHTWLDGVTFPSPVTRLELSLGTTGEMGESLRLWRKRTGPAEGVDKLAGELKARFGHQPLKQARETDPTARLPERRFSLTDIGGE